MSDFEKMCQKSTPTPILLQPMLPKVMEASLWPQIFCFLVPKKYTFAANVAEGNGSLSMASNILFFSAEKVHLCSQCCRR